MGENGQRLGTSMDTASVPRGHYWGVEETKLAREEESVSERSYDGKTTEKLGLIINNHSKCFMTKWCREGGSLKLGDRSP